MTDHDPPITQDQAQMFNMGALHERLAERSRKKTQMIAFGVITVVFCVLTILGVLFWPGSWVLSHIFACAAAITAVYFIDWVDMKMHT